MLFPNKTTSKTTTPIACNPEPLRTLPSLAPEMIIDSSLLPPRPRFRARMTLRQRARAPSPPFDKHTKPKQMSQTPLSGQFFGAATPVKRPSLKL